MWGTERAATCVVGMPTAPPGPCFGARSACAPNPSAATLITRSSGQWAGRALRGTTGSAQPVSRCVGEGLGHAAQHCQWQYVALGAHLVGSPSLHWHYLAISSSSVSLCPTTTGATQAVVTPSTGNRCPTDRLPVVGEAQAAQPPGAWVLPVAPGQAVQAMPPLPLALAAARDLEESEPTGGSPT